MKTSPAKVLIVEDSEPFRNFVRAILSEIPELQIVGEVSDGLQAVESARRLRPDLIVLDIGLPSLNGIEAARRIRTLSPVSKMLFLSQESSAEVAQEAILAGSHGYVVKADAGRELLAAVNTVLRGEHFLGQRFADQNFARGSGHHSLRLLPTFVEP